MLKPLVVVLALLPLPAAAAPWKLDPATTVTADVGWQGRTVAGALPHALRRRSTSTRTTPSAPAPASASPRRDATTGVAVVDTLLRSRDYLGAEQYPTITFQLDKLTQTSKSTAEVAGRMTLRGVTRPVSFQARVFAYGPAKDDPGRFEAGFDLSGRSTAPTSARPAACRRSPPMLPVHIRLLMTSR